MKAKTDSINCYLFLSINKPPSAIIDNYRAFPVEFYNKDKRFAAFFRAIYFIRRLLAAKITRRSTGGGGMGVSR
jgi:hypothetical protein